MSTCGSPTTGWRSHRRPRCWPSHGRGRARTAARAVRGGRRRRRRRPGRRPPDRRLRGSWSTSRPASPPTWSSRSAARRYFPRRVLDHGRDGALPILTQDFALGRGDRARRRGLAGRDGPAWPDRRQSKLRACPLTAGHYGFRMRTAGAWSVCSPSSRTTTSDLAWAHPVDGVAAYVDLIERKVFRLVDDLDLPVPRNQATTTTRPCAVRCATGLRPIEITQPDGPIFTVDGQTLGWQGWSMRIGFDAREGLSLHQIIAWTGGGRSSTGPRSPRWSCRTATRAPPATGRTTSTTGEYLVGKLANSLERGCDCLGEIDYLDATITDDDGEPREIAQRDLHPRGGLRRPLEAHRHLHRLGPGPAPAPAGGLVLHHRRQLRLRLLLVLLPRRHDRVRDEAHRRGVHLGLPGSRITPTPRRSLPASARPCISICSAPGST